MCSLLRIPMCFKLQVLEIDLANISEHISIWAKQKLQPYHLLHLSAHAPGIITNTIMTGTK